MADIAKRAGVSRQALYLHFPNRAELLVATARYLDEVHAIGTEFDRHVMGQAGTERLTGFVNTWGDYIPRVYGVGKALMAMKDTDQEARAAWDDRMGAVRGLCELTVQSLAETGALSEDLGEKTAADLLWTLTSVRNWEQWTQECGWTHAQYLEHLNRAARRLIVSA
ncbi:TetR/AcrR family transcriptional regulator [uncultured Litoreibacter sp.]|uniref:TetR/AcrR family transcriptional regulator n=1 Tax=uncultured Litoreibacter sp. TaxID=1392394 RepID=UPI00262D796F|nr:TetR/AcrR family transcriptional regulator [uncultured Litoreibacter sp.]